VFIANLKTLFSINSSEGTTSGALYGGDSHKWAPAIFSIVRFRYLEIGLSLCAGPQFSNIW
jgi:hypothetical protein